MTMKKILIMLAFVAMLAVTMWGEKRIFVMSDIHVMAPELLVEDGDAFRRYVESDPKLLRQSAEVLLALADTIRRYDPDLIIIPGDLTKDGELVSHRMVAEMLEKLRGEGYPTLLVPGNHDIENPHGKYFKGAATEPAQRTSPEAFAEIYSKFGYDDASQRDPASLSWAKEPFEGLVVIGLDSNWYYKNQYVERGDPADVNQTAGGLREATLQWAIDIADRAMADGKQVIAIAHHNILEHYDGQSFIARPYVIDDWENVADNLTKHGVSIVFTGHQHLHDIAKRYRSAEMKDSLIDVTTGSTVSYPNPWRLVTVNDDFSKWNFATGYVRQTASLDNVQETCRQTLADNISGGLKWHIRQYWPKIQEIIEENSSLIEKWKVNVPATPEEMTSLAMDYFGHLFVEAFLINVTGNEEDNPRSKEIVGEFKTQVAKLVNDRVGKASEVVNVYVENILNDNVYSWLNSMMNDVNQWGTAMASVTDDLDGKPRQGGNSGGGGGDSGYYDLNGRFVGNALSNLRDGQIYVTRGKKVLKTTTPQPTTPQSTTPQPTMP